MSEIRADSLTIILPTLNEEPNISDITTALLSGYPGIRILVVDDDSKDRTGEIVAEFQRKYPDQVRFMLRREVAYHGITASVMDGILATETDFFMVMDADLQHPPSVVACFLQELALGNELVLGARLPYKEKQPLHRVLATRVSTWAAKIRLLCRGICAGDPMSGMFAGRTEQIGDVIKKQSHRFEPQGYKVLFDILRTIEPKPVISQVWYDFGFRQGGFSKLRPSHAWYFFKSLLK